MFRSRLLFIHQIILLSYPAGVHSRQREKPYRSSKALQDPYCYGIMAASGPVLSTLYHVQVDKLLPTWPAVVGLIGSPGIVRMDNVILGSMDNQHGKGVG